jgi:hypothetical protein
MNTTTTETNGSGGGNWIAFVFGAVFNLLAKVDLSFILDYVLQAVVGGIICLAFKIIGDVFSPLWLKHKEKVKEFAKIRNLKFRRKKSRRSEAERE